MNLDDFVECPKCRLLYDPAKCCDFCKVPGADPDGPKISGRLTRIRRYLSDALAGARWANAKLTHAEVQRLILEIDTQINRVQVLEMNEDKLAKIMSIEWQLKEVTAQRDALLKDLQTIKENISVLETNLTKRGVSNQRLEQFIRNLLRQVGYSTVVYASQRSDFVNSRFDFSDVVGQVVTNLKDGE